MYSNREVLKIRLHDKGWKETLLHSMLLQFANFFSSRAVEYRQRRIDAAVRAVFPLINFKHYSAVTEQYYRQKVLLKGTWRGIPVSLLDEGLPSLYGRRYSKT